jgi:aminoglycoside phosphotransferase (APT) family kinase protein
MSEQSELIAGGLAEVFEGSEVENLARLSGGASRETYAFELVRGDGGREAMILQRQRAGSESMRSGGGMATEAALLRAAWSAGVPVAELVVAGGADSPVGAPFLVTRRVDGETIARKILRDDEYATARTKLAAQLGEALAALHRIPVGAAPDLEQHDQVEQYRSVLDALGEPHPAIELGLRWLDQNRPPSERTTVVHGDFRLGNLIVGPDGLRAVLDWEIAHLGDPLEDLGWLCVRAWRFGAPKPVGGFGEYEQLFAAYEAASGTTIDPDVVRWWEILGTLKWGVMCIMQAATHLNGWSRSVELAAIGRRVCENEHDLLDLLP